MILEIKVRPEAVDSIVESIETCIEGLDGIRDYDIDTSGRTMVVEITLETDEAEAEFGATSALDVCLESLEGVLSWSVT